MARVTKGWQAACCWSARACEHAGFEELLVRFTNDKVDAVIMRPVLLAQVFEADCCGAGDVGCRLTGLRARDVSCLKNANDGSEAARLRDDGQKKLRKSGLLLLELKECSGLQ